MKQFAQYQIRGSNRYQPCGNKDQCVQESVEGHHDGARDEALPCRQRGVAK